MDYEFLTIYHSKSSGHPTYIGHRQVGIFALTIINYNRLKFGRLIEQKFFNVSQHYGAHVCCSLRTYHVIEVVIFAVPGVVLPQRPHEDHADQAHQEDDHHKRVEDRKPMDLVEKNSRKGSVSSQHRISRSKYRK